MYLKRIDLCGFKTFADKTTLEFEPGISAIVGPNGSGKSNLTDAVRWVLGEQSAKTLRGGSMEEVVFSGSRHHKPMGMAEVSVLLDNSDSALPIDTHEVSVCRRFFRGGEGQYLINKVPCRLRDVRELLMGTGLGQGALTILGQNEVDLVLSPNSLDRRAILEETAGVSKYRFRKQEASRKLEHTRQNLVRLHDILREVEGQREHLALQVKRLERYQRRREQLRDLERQLRLSDVLVLQARREETRRLLAQVDEELRTRKVKGERVRHAQETRKVELDNLERRLDVENQQWVTLARELEREELILEQGETRARELEERLTRMDQDRESYLQNQQDLVSAEQERGRELEAAANSLEQSKAGVVDQETRRETLQTQWNELAPVLEADEARRAELEKSLAAARQEVGYRQEQAQRNRALAGEAGRAGKELQREARELAGERTKLEKVVAALESALNALSAELEQAVTQVEKARVEEARAAEEFNSLVDRIGLLRARRNALQELETALEGYGPGVRALLGEKKRFPGIRGALSQLIRVPEALEVAVEAVMGEHLQDLVVDSAKTARQAMARLSEKSIGRARFWPLDCLPAPPAGKKGRPAKDPSRLCAQIECPDEIRPVLERILGDVLLVDDLESAQPEPAGHPLPTLVTRNGEVRFSKGARAGGSRPDGGSRLLSRQRELDELATELEILENSHRAAGETLTTAQAGLERWNRSREELRRRLESARIERAERRGDLQAQEHRGENLAERQRTLADQVKEQEAEAVRQDELARAANRKVETGEKEIEKLSGVLEQRRNRSAELGRSLEQLREELADTRREQALLIQRISQQENRGRELATRLAEVTRSLEMLIKEHAGLKAEREKILQVVSEGRGRITSRRMKVKAWEDLCRDLRTQRDNLQSEMESLERDYQEWEGEYRAIEARRHQLELQRVEEETALREQSGRLREMGEERDPEWLSADRMPPREELQEKVERLRRQLEEYQDVNLGANEEFRRLDERQKFLANQIHDLEEAAASLEEAIAHIDETSGRQFMDTFVAVGREFSRMFGEIFGGGEARLELSDPGDPVNSGVEIMACPPGKKMKNLSLLSSGERSLTAIALLLALMRVKPSPFVILDELDAPLDDTNLEKVLDRWEEFSLQSQFIIITHNRKTMERARILHGVTMEEAGVSKLVSVRLEEAANGNGRNQIRDSASTPAPSAKTDDHPESGTNEESAGRVRARRGKRSVRTAKSGAV